MKKGITVLFLLLLAVCGTTGAFAQSASDFTYTTANGQVTITKYTGNATAVVIPATIRGLPVTVIGQSAFLNRKDLASVSIPANVYNILEFAFRGCASLTSISIGANVTVVTSDAGDVFENGLHDFYNRNGRKAGVYTWNGSAWSYTAVAQTAPSSAPIQPTRIESQSGDFTVSMADGQVTITKYTGSATAVVIPATIGGLPVVGIGAGWGQQPFAGRTDLTSINIPASVTSIGGWAFMGCTGLTSISIPASVTSIGFYAFGGCTGLTSVSIPASVTSIDYNAFDNCTGLVSEQSGFKIRLVGGAGGFVTIIGYTGTTTAVIIPATIRGLPVTRIDDAFKNSTGITSVSIPPSVTSVAGNAFDGCTGLTAILVDTNHANYTSRNGVLFNKTGDTLIACPVGLKGQYAIPSGVTSIGMLSFSGCTGLTAISIPTSVTRIEQSAFLHCSSLTSVNIPASVTSIGRWAFADCSGLTSVSIPVGVTFLEDTFDDCIGVTSVSIGANVTLSWGGMGKEFFRNGFGNYYNTNGKKAGVYTFRNGAWNYSAR